MEMRGFSVAFSVPKNWARMRPDSLNRTSLYLDNRLVWPLEEGEQPPVLPAEGVAFRLEIPSGTLTGTIVRIVDEDDLYEAWTIGDARWTGKFAGLVGGRCGIGTFCIWIRSDTIILSSIADTPLTYEEYTAIRKFADAACAKGQLGQAIWLEPEKNRVLLRSAWKYLRALREEAKRLADREGGDKA